MWFITFWFHVHFTQLESFEHTDTCTVLRTTRSFLNWPTVSCFVVRLHQVWLCNDSNELSLSVHVFGVCETTGHQQAHQTHDTDIWYQYRTSEVKFLDSRQRLPLFILITQTIRIWPTSYWHTPPSWKQGPTGPTSILQPLVCCLPRTKALLSHLSDEITPMLVARWGDGRDPGPCRRRGSTWTHGVLRKRQGREGGGLQSTWTHAVGSRGDTYTDPLSPSRYGHNPEWHFKKNTLASFVCWQCSTMAC